MRYGAAILACFLTCQPVAIEQHNEPGKERPVIRIEFEEMESRPIDARTKRVVEEFWKEAEKPERRK